MNVLNSIQNMPQNAGVITNNQQQSIQNINIKTEPYKPDLMDIFCEKVVNKNDIQDMVTTPRAIFKGYLCFTTGTAINTIASFVKNNKIANPLKILGCIASIYGTYNFVKPYLIRSDKFTKE